MKGVRSKHVRDQSPNFEELFLIRFIHFSSSYNHFLFQPPHIEKRLKCYLWTNNNHPRLVFQPVKLEELWNSPHLVRFYDVMSDDEIAVIKSIAKPRVRRFHYLLIPLKITSTFLNVHVDYLLQ